MDGLQGSKGKFSCLVPPGPQILIPVQPAQQSQSVVPQPLAPMLAGGSVRGSVVAVSPPQIPRVTLPMSMTMPASAGPPRMGSPSLARSPSQTTLSCGGSMEVPVGAPTSQRLSSPAPMSPQLSTMPPQLSCTARLSHARSVPSISNISSSKTLSTYRSIEGPVGPPMHYPSRVASNLEVIDVDPRIQPLRSPSLLPP